MKEYKIQKEVRQEAVIIGLKVSFFYIFFGIALFMFFLLINGITLPLLLFVIGVIVATYVVLLLVQNIDFEKYFSNLPKNLHNK